MIRRNFWQSLKNSVHGVQSHLKLSKFVIDTINSFVAGPRVAQRNEYYYIDTSVLLENYTPLVKFIRNHIPDSSGIFSISSLVRISMISLISSLSLKLYFNSLVYDQRIFGSSSKVFANLRAPSEIVGKCSATFV